MTKKLKKTQYFHQFEKQITICRNFAKKITIRNQHSPWEAGYKL
jgi:hypothetical protein